MNRLSALLLVLVLCTTHMADAGDGSRCFIVSLPERWQEATRIRLVLEDVTVPGDQPLKIRINTTDRDGRIGFLGSVGVEAMSRSSKDVRHLPHLQLVTRPFKELLEGKPDAKELELCVQAVDGRNAPIREGAWSVKSVHFETQ